MPEAEFYLENIGSENRYKKEPSGYTEARDKDGNPVELVPVCRWCDPQDPQELPEGKLYTNEICKPHLAQYTVVPKITHERVPIANLKKKPTKVSSEIIGEM